MKTLIALLASLPLFAHSAEKPLPKNFSFRCISNLPTTSFLGEVKSDAFELTVIHHHGKPFMPIHQGIIVPNDFPYLKEKADALTKMSDRNTFRFPLEGCKLYGPTLFSCPNGEEKEFEGVPFRAMYFHTSRITEEVFDMRFERTKAVLSLHLPSTYLPVQEIPMEYYEGECAFSTALQQ